MTTEIDMYDLGGHLVSAFDGSGNLTRGEIYAGNQHVATHTNGTAGTTYFNHADWLGTERARSSMTASICETVLSQPFGDNQQTSGSCGDPSPNHFTGKQRDIESGNDYFGARYYVSTFGRFISPDPGPFIWSDPQTVNRYAYARNNPLKFIDLAGMYFVVAAKQRKFYEKALTDIYRRPGGRELVNTLANSNRPVILDRGELDTATTRRVGVSDALGIYGTPGVSGVHTTIGTDKDLFTGAVRDPGEVGPSKTTVHELEHDKEGLAQGQASLQAGGAAMEAGDAPISPGAKDTLGGTAQAAADEIMGEKPDMSKKDAKADVKSLLNSGQQQWQDSQTRKSLCDQNKDACPH